MIEGLNILEEDPSWTEGIHPPAVVQPPVDVMNSLPVTTTTTTTTTTGLIFNTKPSGVGSRSTLNPPGAGLHGLGSRRRGLWLNV